MMRKVIQIAGSTQLVSLPRQWAKAHNIARGQEIDVQEDGDRVIVSTSNTPPIEKVEIDVSELNGMIARFIHALYKRGVDEIKVYFGKPEIMVKIQEAISKEAVGYEVLEQGSGNCTIRYVSGSLEEFDSVLRRTFLLLLTMSEQTYDSLKTTNYPQLKNTAFLEEANNRFTTVCRRHLNKMGTQAHGKIGPLYYIVEELEKIADQYKYICQHFSNLQDKKIMINTDVLNLFEFSNKMLRVFYELFYKFDVDKIVQLKESRDKVVETAHKLFEKRLTHADYWMLHHSIVLANMIFCLVGPYITSVGIPNILSRNE